MQTREDLIETMACAMCERDGRVWRYTPNLLKAEYRSSATAALAAIEAAGARVVPLKMCDEFDSAWADLLAASPFAPPQQEAHTDGEA